MKQFKHYDKDQLPMFPLDIGEMIDDNHLVRVINGFVDSLSMDLLTKPFEKVGKLAYHPRMMMKVVLYSYSTKLFSTRKMATIIPPLTRLNIGLHSTKLLP